MRIKQYLLLAGAIGAFLIIFTVFFMPTSKPNPRIETLYVMADIQRAFEESDLDERLALQKLLETQTDGLSINASVAHWIRNKTNTASLVLFSSNSSLLLDSWSSPLNFALRSSNTASRLLPILSKETNSLLIWSSGPNRSNEYGLWDDVVLPAGWAESHLPKRRN